MAFTYADVITGARVEVNDSASPYRVQDDKLLAFVKKAVQEAVILRPDLFATRGTTTLIAGVEQNLQATRAIYLVAILGIQNGAYVDECDYWTLSRFRPGWRTETATNTAENWMRHPEDANRKQTKRFLVYPPSLAGQVFEALWSEAPDMMSITTGNMASNNVPLGDEYLPALQHYVAFEVESLNDENARVERAQPHYQMFAALMGANKAIAPREGT